MAKTKADQIQEMPDKDREFLNRLFAEHNRKTAAIVEKLAEARAALLIPEPDDPLAELGDDGLPITDPDTGKMVIAPVGSPEYEAFLQEHAEAIDLHKQWEEAAINAPFVNLRRELAQANQDMQRKMDEYLDRIKNAKSISPKSAKQYVAPTDLVSARVFSGELSTIPENIRISGAGAKKPVITSVSVDFEAIEGDDAISGRKRLDRYTQAVYQAIIALWNAGNTYLTTGMIYSTMTGNDGKVPQKQADMIAQSIQTLMKSVVSINSADEQRLKAYGAVKAAYYGNLITAKAATVTIKGKRVDSAIQIFSAPILYEYAAAKKQIATGNVALLNAPINKTPENIVLIDYLRRRVDMLKTSRPNDPKKKAQNKIRYDAIYEALEITGNDATAKNRKYRVRGYVVKTLDFWKEQGYIQDYSEYCKDGKTYAEGIQITPVETGDMIPQEGEPTAPI